MDLLLIVFSGFALAAVAAPLARAVPRIAGWLLALLPASIALTLIALIPDVMGNGPRTASVLWVPSLGVNLSFYLDALSLLLALMVSGIGALVLVYGHGYLKGDEGIGRFYTYVLIFMAAMLGLVLSDNLFLLFIFWELTSISSYLLIGYKNQYETSRNAALQALLVTGGGGLAMLAGFVVLALAAGSAELSTIRIADLFDPSAAQYEVVLILILLGAFTKSAQFPFHFWLPNAMVAPTPVSTYLHSATMVKAGIYLMARLSPVLSGTELWTNILVLFGGITMLLGAYLAWQQSDMKRILAYSTLSVLGTLTLLIGLDTELALEAALVFMLAHALYKGALFMVAGAIDHETGTRDLGKLGGLRTAMPITCIAAAVAGFSMAGLPPFIGFIGKELDYDALLHESGAFAITLESVSIVANALVAVAAGLVVIKPFFGRKPAYTREPHEPPVSMWLGPVLLATLGFMFGLFPVLIDESLISPAAGAITESEVHAKLALWHGFNIPLALSAVTIGLAVVVYLLRDRLLPVVGRVSGERFGANRIYEWTLDRFLKSADAITHFLQNGNLRVYLNVIVTVAVLLVGGTFLAYAGTDLTLNTDFDGITPFFALLCVMIVVGAIMAARFESRLAAIAALGTIGYAIALLFLLFGAPDLAMTQFSIETLSVVVIVLVVWKLPRFARLTRRADRIKDVVIAASVGVLMTLFVLVISAEPMVSRLTPYFVENSYELAKGKNVVNVILVDFRGFDTLGEITVLSVAGIGVYVLARLRAEKRRRPNDDA